MEVTCPNCEMSFSENSMESRFGLLVCSNCDHRFKPKLSGNTSLPSIYTVANEGSDLVIRKKWYRKIWVLAFSANFAAWFLFLLCISFIPHKREDGEFVLIIIMGLICFIMAYLVILYLFGVTEIRAGRTGIDVTYAAPFPVPFLKNISLPLNSLEQIFCHQKLSTANRGKQAITYDISAVLKSGDTAKIDNVETWEEGKAVEAILEKHLGIEDVAVEVGYGI